MVSIGTIQTIAPADPGVYRMEKHDRQFKGVWIPREIWLNGELSILEKVLLTEINSLDNEKGCYASNKYFAEFFGISERQISKYVGQLDAKGLIKIHMIGRNKRTILMEQKFHQGTNKSSISDRTKVPHSNIVSNQVSKNINSRFEEFWKAYPRKISKKVAEVIFGRIKADQFDAIMAGLEKYKATPQWLKDGGQFIPHPTTWLRQERWKDEIEPVKISATKNKYAGI